MGEWQYSQVLTGILTLNRLPAGTSKSTVDLTDEDLELGSAEILGVRRCVLTLVIENHENEFIVRGECDFSLTVECSRCLDAFEMSDSLDIAFVVKLLRASEISAAGEDSSEDFYVMPIGADDFDLRPIARERLLLSLPLKFLCKEECRGLCPVCGINKNSGTCDCRQETSDERWAELAKLRDQMGGN